MALNAYLKIKANGTDLPGESSHKGFENWIEVQSFSWGAITAREAGSGLSTGRRVYKEFRWVNRHHKSSVLLWKALAQNQVIEAEVHCVKPSSSGDGSEENFLKLAFKQARMSAFDQAGEDVDVYEEFGLVFQTVTMTHTDGGIEFEDNWSQQA
ncbi:MAG TPA: type VI secretion system tube protein Hcp [Gaiellaceae bacterium]|nr:type VI secretion system tube protein Hcp [Gaiellaceae bacterium]